MGWSVVRMARESFGLSAAADGFGAAFFGNGARPGGVLEHPLKLTPAAQDTIRAAWNRLYSGVDNAGSVAILAEGMKFSPYSMPNNEAQFLETRRFQVEEICRWFRVPPQKVADHSRSTFGNVEEINAQYADDSLGGWMRRWEGEGRRKLFTQDQMMRYRLEHNEAELRRGRGGHAGVGVARVLGQERRGARAVEGLVAHEVAVVGLAGEGVVDRAHRITFRPGRRRGRGRRSRARSST